MDSRTAAERTKDLAQREAELAGELEALALEAELPSEEDLADHRKVRDETWSLAKASWLEGQAVTGEATPYPDERALASFYERASEDADSAVGRFHKYSS